MEGEEWKENEMEKAESRASYGGPDLVSKSYRTKVFLFHSMKPRLRISWTWRIPSMPNLRQGSEALSWAHARVVVVGAVAPGDLSWASPRPHFTPPAYLQCDQREIQRPHSPSRRNLTQWSEKPPLIHRDRAWFQNAKGLLPFLPLTLFALLWATKQIPQEYPHDSFLLHISGTKPGVSLKNFKVGIHSRLEQWENIQVSYCSSR